jgi:hypothetical protein
MKKLTVGMNGDNMTTFKHIVQVHPVENGEPNLHKVEDEKEFDTLEEAQGCIKLFEKQYANMSHLFNAVYRGCVNVETGELE